MQLTLLSFIMSVLWSCIIILLVHFLRKKTFFLNGFGVTTVIFLYIFSICRMFFAVEFSFTQVIPLPELYNRFFQTVYFDRILFHELDFSIADIFVVIWFIVSFVLIAYFFIRHYIATKTIDTLSTKSNAELENSLSIIRKQYQSKINIDVCICYGISVPMGVGILKKRILIPHADYSEKEIQYILLHEFMHFRNKDLLVRLLIEVFSRIFWWNPLVYLLKADVLQILEIKCDLSVISDMTETQRIAYLKTISSCMVQSKKIKTLMSPTFSTHFFNRNSKFQELSERVQLVAYPVKRNRTKFQIISVICYFVILFLSYTFIFQPRG